MNTKPIEELLHQYEQLKVYFPSARMSHLIDLCEQAKTPLQDEIDRINDLQRITEKHEEKIEMLEAKIEALDEAYETLSELQNSYAELADKMDIISAD